MLIDSMVIKLTRGGAGIDSEYSLTIRGDGKVIYTGIENVKIKGIVASSIDDDKITSLLLDFKKSGFSSLNYISPVEGSIVKPYTVISISVPNENGEMVTKSIKYYHEDKNIPKELMALGDKIDKTVGLDKWVGEKSEMERFEKRDKLKLGREPIDSGKKKPVKLIAVGVSIIIIVGVLFFSMYIGIIGFPFQEQNSDEIAGSDNDTQGTMYSTVEIVDFNPAGYIDMDTGEYIYQPGFNIGDNISIYLKYTNISTVNNETCDLHFDLVVKDFNGTEYHRPPGVNRTFIGKSIQIWWFETKDWPAGVYLVDVYLTDNISNSTVSDLTFFTLGEIY